MNEALVENMVRVGKVTAVNVVKRQVRVFFPSLGITSGWLFVPKHSLLELWLPSVNDTVVCLYIPTLNGDGFVIGEI